MMYVDDISALAFWTSAARGKVSLGPRNRVSELRSCPASPAESDRADLSALPEEAFPLHLAVPAPELRVRRSRFKYRVWPNGIPRGSFIVVNDHVAVASPALALAETCKKASVLTTCQHICELRGSYVRLRGGGMIDHLQPATSAREIEETACALRGRFDTRKLLAALELSGANSASPKETEQYLLFSLGKRRGGAGIDCWEMNVPLDVPKEFQRYLGKEKVFPDLYNEKHKVDVEYVSGACHDNPKSWHSDSRRTNVLRAMGIQVIPVHPEDIATASKFENIVKMASEALGLAYRPASQQTLAARARLMRELRS